MDKKTRALLVINIRGWNENFEFELVVGYQHAGSV